MEPVRVRILRKWVDSYTILLVDRSSSMDLTDSYRDEATAGRVKKLLNTEQRKSPTAKAMGHPTDTGRDAGGTGQCSVRPPWRT